MSKNSGIDEKEKEIVEFWKENNTFEKSLENTKCKGTYTFYDGPPFATGLPHYGHILASVIKDVIPRFWTMNNKYVGRVWGWDCHGLPVETIAEEELDIGSKDEIEEMGVKKFNDFCRSKVMKYAEEWKDVVDRIGRWVDMENDYKTMDTSYIESVWWAFKELYKKGYIYEGEKILMYCPRCSTPLSKSEIAMDNSYKMREDKSVTIKFKLNDEEVYALAWTTTPWTLLSNLALTVHPELEYAYVKDKDDGNTYLLAKELISDYYKSEDEYKIEKTVKGKELEGKKYEPLFSYFEDSENAFQIILGDFVTLEEGTGIVHTAPAFGEDDYDVCQKYNIPLVQPVDEEGNFTKEVGDYEGEYIFDTNQKIIDKLKREGKIVRVEEKSHEYPYCYRCDTPLIYRAIPSWFVNIQKIKPRLLELNEKISWYPGFLKEGRVKHNIENAPDWNISRNRYWASAIPIWKSESGKMKVIGSIEELKEYAIELPEDEEINLHKDYLDKVKLKDEEGEVYERVPEVLDCWFESGSMTFAQFHYPFENKEKFKKNFPAEFVAEYIGQTRAWFYYMLVMSAILFDDIPFKNVLTTGTILNKDGEKMSKSKKNFPDPQKIIKEYGVDSLRFYLLSSVVMNADNLHFSEEKVEEIYKKVLLLLYNVNRFYSIYSEKDGGEIKEINPKETMDRWIISRLNNTIKKITRHMKNYNTIKTCDQIWDFVNDLSTWYIRRTRDRFKEDDKDAIKTLGVVLEKFSRVIAPVMPFVSERVFRNVTNKGSVHLQEWPEFEDKKIDEGMMEEMAKAREIASAGLRERDREQMGLKWPLPKAKFMIDDPKIGEEIREVIKDELNVRELEFVGGKREEGEEIKVELDTNLTPELESRGYANVVARKVQSARKKQGLNKEDKIKLSLKGGKELEEMLKGEKEYLKGRVNSEKVFFGEEKFKNKEEFSINNKKVVISFEKTS